jgi:hypothetical protein
LFFCSVSCWDAHVPMMRHRDAWAEKVVAPTREQYLAELAEEEKAEVSDEADKGRRIVGLSDDGLPKDVLVVVSKLKAYVKARSGMSTSDGAIDVLSAHLRKLCDRAIRHAGTAGPQNGHGSRLRSDPEIERRLILRARGYGAIVPSQRIPKARSHVTLSSGSG